MKVKVAQYEFSGPFILVVLVASEFTLQDAGKQMIARIEPYYPTLAIMLVSIEHNGFRAFSFFQSHKILALLQLDNLSFTELDLTVPPIDTSELPF